MDDEYFRLAVLAGATDHQQGAKAWEDALRSLRKRPKLRQALVEKITPVELRTKAGLYLGTATAISMSGSRIDRVVQRIVRGLLWHHYKVILPPTTTAFNTWQDPDVRPIEAMLRDDTVLSAVGGEVFRYRHGVAAESPLVSLWWTRFYAKTYFVTIVDGTAEKVVIPTK